MSLKWETWAVCGRIPGDDDDTLYIIRASPGENYRELFVECLYADRGRKLPDGWLGPDGFEDEELREAHGVDAWAYVTGAELVVPAIDAREKATILAALSFWREHTCSHDRWHDPIATGAPSDTPSDACLAPLSDDEINTLREKLENQK